MVLVASSRTRMRPLLSILAFWAILVPGARADVFTDNFSGTVLNSRWEAATPLDGQKLTVNNRLTFSIPAGVVSDEWTDSDNAPRVELPGPTGDFAVSAELRAVNVSGGNFHSVIEIDFDPYHKIFWGAYQSPTHLQLERSGPNAAGNIGGVNIRRLPVWLQVVKRGSIFRFYYKQNDSDNWSTLTNADGYPLDLKESTDAVAGVGLMLKTWSDVPLSSTWSSFSLDPSLSSFGTLSGKIASTGGSASKISVEIIDASGKVAAFSPVNPDGSYSLALVPPGAYTVRLKGDDLESAAEDSATSAVVQAGANVEVNFSDVRIAPDLSAPTDYVFADSFAGTTLGPRWNLSIPRSGASVTVNDGLQFHVPMGSFDYYTFDTTTNDAPKVETPAPDGDFTASVEIVSANDPSGSPIDGAPYRTGLTVDFGDATYFCIGLDTFTSQLMAERPRFDAIDFSERTFLPVWVEIQKTGDVYSFLYKQNASDPWQPITDADGNAITRVLSKKPRRLQLMTETFFGPAIDVTFKDFRLETPSPVSVGTISGVIVTNGPSPSKASVRVTDGDGAVAAFVPIGSDGAYSAYVPEGEYTVAVVGNAVADASDKASRSVAVSASSTIKADFSLHYAPDLDPATDAVFEDLFAGPRPNPPWSLHIPVPGPTIRTGNGLTMNIPPNTSYDYWTGNVSAPTITMPAPSGDFMMSGKLESTLDKNGNEVTDSFHAGLYVNFGGSDALFWGAYKSDNYLQLERSAYSSLGSASDALVPLWVGIRRYGDDYAFYYKQNDNDAWTQLVDGNGTPVLQTNHAPAVSVGLILKTWSSVNVIARWSDFKLETPKLSPLVRSGDLNGDSAVNVQDATIALRIAVGLTAPTAEQILLGDVAPASAPNGKIDVSDATLILRAAVGLVSLP
jgi:hypothetical protein